MTIGCRLGVLAATVLTVAAAGAGVASAGASGASSEPPCTKLALAAGLRRGAAQPAEVRITGSFACADGWAYSGVLVGNRRTGVEAVAVFRARHGAWYAVDRAKPCRTHAIPKKLYRSACTTS